jgi:predicted DNA-binding transcriptional regulator AlpA
MNEPMQLDFPFMEADAKCARDDLGIMTEQDLAIALGLKSTTTLATWRAEKTGPKPAKLGKAVFYRVEDIKAWIAERACVA